MNWRDVKRQARQQVDDTMRLPCWRVSHDGSVTATWARLHIARPNVTNDFSGELESLGYQERAHQAPKLVFKLSRMQPRTGDMYLFQANEAYGVEDTRPTDDQYQTADCYRCTQQQIDTALEELAPDERAKIVFPVPEID